MKHYSTWIAKAIKRYLRKNGVQAVAFDRNEGKIEFIVPSHSQIAYFHYVIQIKDRLPEEHPVRTNAVVFRPLHGGIPAHVLP